jgi:hypothetical protein
MANDPEKDVLLDEVHVSLYGPRRMGDALERADLTARWMQAVAEVTNALLAAHPELEDVRVEVTI